LALTGVAREKEIAALLDAAAAHYAQGRLDEAARFYRQAERADPRDIRAAYSLAVIDLRAGRAEPARRRLRTVVAREPGLFAAQQNLGAVCQDLALWAEAADAYARAILLRPDAAETRFSLARALTILGRTDQALGCYRALSADPSNRLRALTLMAVLDPAAVDDSELAALQGAARDPVLEDEIRTGLLFALGDVLDWRGMDDEAFAAYTEGNRLKRDALAAGPIAGHPETVALGHAETNRFIQSLFTADFIARHSGAGSASSAPIFIVGMPRSGSSLIEQILSSHRKVQGLGESGVLSRLTDTGFPGAGQPGDPARWRPLAEAYLAAMRGRGWKGAPRFVDKTLENYLRVGLIHLMFPGAVILHSLRDPVDTCLACFRQLFTTDEQTLYDLGEIGEAYVRYRRMMDHWREALPGRVIDVDHEALAADPGGRIRWLVTEACGLDWDPNCLNFHETQGAVRTASAAQVRRPIFQTSIRRWRRYADHLGPLFEALGPYAPPTA
jgi:tetratricopeptide (TPR) repeat protein